MGHDIGDGHWSIVQLDTLQVVGDSLCRDVSEEQHIKTVRL